MADIVSYFQLKELPFELTPNLRFYCQYESHQNALNTVLYCISEGEGFIKITGEVGTGKTILCRKLIDELDEHGDISLYIPNPSLSTEALLRSIVDELGHDYGDDIAEYELNKAINDKLLAFHQQNKKVVLFVDEAQTMSDEGLEALRLLSNLEAEERKLLQIVLFGQPELDRKLSEPHLRQVRQRIRFSYQMNPLGKEEVDTYVAKRLIAAGHETGLLFSKSARNLIYSASKGVPRVVNVLAYKSLLAAYADDQSVVNASSVKKAIGDSKDVISTVTSTKPNVAPLLLTLAAVIGCAIVMFFLI